MLTELIAVCDSSTPKITIGRRGTYGSEQVVFNLTHLIETYGAGSAVLMVKRPQDETAYPAVTTKDETALTWVISDVDTAYKGSGECEIFWYVDDALTKTVIYPLAILRDIGETTEEPPDGYQNWVDSLTALGAETQENARKAAKSAEEADLAAEDAGKAADDAEKAAETAEQAAADVSEAVQRAETAASRAETSAESASSSATNAANSASTATTKANQAASSAQSASQNASAANASAGSASQSASSARESASAAAGSASDAASSAQFASESAASASQAATNAANSASEATTQAGNAAAKAGEASESATAAGNAQSAAETAQGKAEDAQEAAEEAQAAAEAAVESIRYGGMNIVALPGTVLTQTGADNTMYICGEVAELTFTALANTSTAIRFDSGATPTVLTMNGVDKWMFYFDPDNLKANVTYEISVVYGVGVAGWA